MKIPPVIYEKLSQFLMSKGVLRAVLIFTVGSIAASLLITYLISAFFLGGIDSTGFWIAFIVPAIVAPLFSSIHLSLAYELELMREKIRVQAITDDLTQAFNRRHFMDQARREFDRSLRHAHLLSIVLFDVDDFKKINDTYGHLCGDMVLKAISELCQAAVRQHDVFARYGGEEFVAMLPETDDQNAGAVAERFRRLISNCVLEYGGKPVKLTISVGVTTKNNADKELVDLLKRADQALYEAKRTGKNSVVVR